MYSMAEMFDKHVKYRIKTHHYVLAAGRFKHSCQARRCAVSARGMGVQLIAECRVASVVLALSQRASEPLCSPSVIGFYPSVTKL